MLKTSLLLMSLIFLSIGCGNGGNGEKEPLPVNVTVVHPEMISRTVYAPCRLEAGSEAVVSVAVPAVVEEVLVSPGDTVSAGQRLIALRTDDMRQAELSAAAAVVEAAGASNRYAAGNLSRATELFQVGAMSLSDYQRIQTSASAAEATYRQAAAGYSAAAASTGSGYVKAPFNGIVGRVLATDGNPASGPLLSIFSGEVLQAEVLLAPKHISDLEPGIPAVFQTDHFPGRVFTGSVISVSNAADPVSGLVSLRVQFSDPSDFLVPGLSGMCMVLLETRESAIVLSETALTPVSECCWQAAVLRDGRADLVMVRTGINNGIRHEVLEGILPGDSVITLGHTLVVQDEQVRVVN